MKLTALGKTIRIQTNSENILNNTNKSLQMKLNRTYFPKNPFNTIPNSKKENEK